MSERVEYMEHFPDVFMRAVQYAPVKNLLVSLQNFDSMLMEIGWESRPVLLKDCKVMVRRADMQAVFDRLQKHLLARGAELKTH